LLLYLSFGRFPNALYRTQVEAVDRKFKDIVTVATIKEIKGTQVRPRASGRNVVSMQLF
jgi:hypothetical protein